MEPSFVLTANTLDIAPGTKVLKADDAAHWVDARALLDAARDRAAAIEREAVEAREAEKARGYEEGLMEGKMEMAERMLDTLGRSVDSLGEMENAMVDVVMHSLRTILGGIEDSELIVSVVRQALQRVRDQKRVTLRVCDEEQPVVQERMKEILRDQPGLGMVDVVGDGRLERGACVLETEMGVVDASLDKQLALLEKSFRTELVGRKDEE